MLRVFVLFVLLAAPSATSLVAGPFAQGEIPPPQVSVEWQTSLTSFGSDFVYSLEPGPGGTAYLGGLSDRLSASDTMGGGIIARVGANGTPIWTRAWNMSSLEGWMRVQPDTQGNAVLVSQASILIFDSAGELTANRVLVGSQRPVASDFALGPDGSVYVGGSLLSAYDVPVAGFVARMDATGAMLWSRRIENLSVIAVAANGSAGVFLAGTNASGAGIVVALATDGALRWTIELGALHVRHLASDGQGGVYSVGQRRDPDFGDQLFLARITQAGLVRWVRVLSATLGGYGYDVAADAFGNVYASGWLYHSSPPQKLVVAKLRENGSLLWALEWCATRSGDSSSGWGIRAIRPGRLLIAGQGYDVGCGLGPAAAVSTFETVVPNRGNASVADAGLGLTSGSTRTWNVSLTVNAPRNLDIYLFGVHDVQSPTPEAAYAPQAPSAGEDVSFTANGSFDMDGAIANYSWDFGDGGRAEGAIVTHRYLAAGNYTATLTVWDNAGNPNSLAVAVSVRAAPEDLRWVWVLGGAILVGVIVLVGFVILRHSRKPR